MVPNDQRSPQVIMDDAQGWRVRFQLRHGFYKMKNHWKRYCRQGLSMWVVIGISISFFDSIGRGQQRPVGQIPNAQIPNSQIPSPQRIGNQSVAPPTSGYGNRPTPGSQPAGNAPQPTVQPQAAQPQPGVQPSQLGNSQLNPNLNPSKNPLPVGAQVPESGSGKEIVTRDPYADKPMTPQDIARLDQVLTFWEKSTADISRYACKFRRWQYNSNDNFVAQLATQLKVDVRSINTTVASGEVKYMGPDKGMFKIDRLLSLTGQVANNRPEYKDFDNRFGEWWLCDGDWVYEYDRTSKRCTKHKLPPDMQGTAILDSPMPFVFGVKAAKIKERYWARILPSPEQQGKLNNDLVVIEVYPKIQSDAVNYDHVQIYLDRQAGLPVMLIKYNTEHQDEPGKVLADNREIFEFTDREKNATLLQKISDVVWRKEFIPFDPPNDWKTIEVPYAPPAAEDFRAAGVPPSGFAPNNQPISTRR